MTTENYNSLTMRIARLLAMVSWVWVGIAVTSTPGYGQTAACLRLQNQLNQLSVGAVPRNASAQYRKYDRAAQKQRVQIQKTMAMARRNGCQAGIFSRRTGSCNRILGALDQMNANLANLVQQKRRFAGLGKKSPKRQRRALLRAMSDRGCFAGRNQRMARLQPRKRSLVEQIFGIRTFSDDGQEHGGFERPQLRLRGRGNTFRTLCVRMNDGYYFPISFSTSPDRFDSDESLCKARCPGSQVELYFHAIPGQDSEDMVAYRGQTPYASLENAFAYRKNFDVNNRCTYRSSGLTEIAGTNRSLQRKSGQSDESNTTPTPIYRIDRSLDAETRANANGGFDLEQARQILNPKAEPNDQIASNGKKIRIVGSAFFPVQ